MKLHKHNQKECEQAMNGIKDLVEQIKRIEDETTKKHVCDSILDLCNNLLRNGKEI